MIDFFVLKAILINVIALDDMHGNSQDAAIHANARKAPAPYITGPCI